MDQHIVQIADQETIPFPIPGATPGGTRAQILNMDLAYGPPTFIIRLEPGTTIPAHVHHNTAETHYVLEGDFIEDGVTYGAGSFFSHPVGMRHGPHSSQTGCAVLTVQNAPVDATDFHIVA